ncbi:TlpA family protein disulfide reductase [Nocardioides sp. GY 10113]|uniref:TlpA family protein disulfide reductase n=1 Tax=Nocardioides sp. GY 10113 TaxID=2569761 RepID=UPI0010A90EC6|nr:TlpA disulfide reductase family protein [Nocardioides sp. GY 10113]TIC89196.1 TlpA family protein disulfide reductase [Nocardioides sp. GY 10113]
MRARTVAVSLLAAGVLLTGCDGGAPAAACRVDVTYPDLIADREAAGIADCDPDDWSTSADGVAADLPDVELHCLGSTATASLADVRGPAVINFWASNCLPCREELPALQAFSEDYGDQVTVLGVDFLDSYPGAAVDLAAEAGVTYPSLADGCGDLQSTDLVLNGGLPQFFFVRADGSWTQRLGGVDSEREIVDMVESELGLDLAAPARKGEGS